MIQMMMNLCCCELFLFCCQTFEIFSFQTGDLVNMCTPNNNDLIQEKLSQNNACWSYSSSKRVLMKLRVINRLISIGLLRASRTKKTRIKRKPVLSPSSQQTTAEFFHINPCHRINNLTDI